MGWVACKCHGLTCQAILAVEKPTDAEEQLPDEWVNAPCVLAVIKDTNRTQINGAHACGGTHREVNGVK